jgi:hypothetical protein
MLVMVGYHPFSVKARPRSAAVMTAAVYSAVSAGRAVGAAQMSAECLWDSALTGSPDHVLGVNANPTRVSEVPRLRWWIDKTCRRAEHDAGLFEGLAGGSLADALAVLKVP